MAPKKKPIVEDPEPAAEVPQTTTPVPAKHAGGVTPRCISCKYIELGLRGPTCVNPSSIYYNVRVRDEDSCGFFTAKA
jgi:hypothetical protein